MNLTDHETVIPVKSPNKLKICDVLLKGSDILVIIKSHGKNDIFSINYLIDKLLDIRDGTAKSDPIGPDSTRGK